MVYEAFGRGDVGTILGLVTDDVDWASEAGPEGAPWHGRRVGKEAVTGFFEGIGASLEVEEFTPLTFTTSDDEVMTRIHFRVRSKDGAREADMYLHHYWRFRDGLIEFYRGSEDTAQVEALLAG